MANELVPYCVSILAQGTLKATMGALVADLVANLGASNVGLTVEATHSSDGGNDDRVLLKGEDGGQIWLGMDGSSIRALVDPEAELSDAELPTEAGSRSPFRSTPTTSYKLLFAGYPDAFLLVGVDGQTTLKWVIHGGRVITTWNASDAAKGLTGHMIMYSANNNLTTASNGFFVANASAIRTGPQTWQDVRTAASGWTPTNDGIRSGWWQPTPYLLFTSSNNPVGFTRYMRRDTENNNYGKVRTTDGSDQAWLCIDNGGSTTSYPWYLWDKTVNPNQ